MKKEFLKETAVKMAVLDVVKKGNVKEITEYMKTEQFLKSAKNYYNMLISEF